MTSEFSVPNGGLAPRLTFRAAPGNARALLPVSASLAHQEWYEQVKRLVLSWLRQMSVRLVTKVLSLAARHIPRGYLAVVTALLSTFLLVQEVRCQSTLMGQDEARGGPDLQWMPELPPRDWNVGVTLGAGVGLSAMGSSVAHDLAVAALHVGKSFDGDRSEFRWLLRRVELAGELWAGSQYHPDSAYLVGLTPVLRCRLLPDSRWTPFVDCGAGITATDIHHPDLSTTFEFNLQAGAGVEWRCRQNTAIVVQARYLHLSNACIDTPNLGVNSLLFSVGLTWFF